MKKVLKIAVPSSLAFGAYFGYQLQLGSYSSSGAIVEVRKAPKRIHYYEYTADFKSSEIEISKFVNDMMEQNVAGTYVKIQLDDPVVTGDKTRFIIGVEESAVNEKDLTKFNDRFKVIQTEEVSAVESNLSFENKNYLLSAMQMTYIVDPAITKFASSQKNNAELPGLSTINPIKSITISENNQIRNAAIAYPFGNAANAFLSQLQSNYNQPNQPKQQDEAPSNVK